jgi:acetylornithine deacetylase/succinyl-diaminopimelate desuccinylase-like protein
MEIALDALKKWYHEQAQEILKDFLTFLSFPSISTDPGHAQDSRNTADWLCAYLNRIGLKASLWETPGFPVVFASYLKPGPNRPTVLIYNHYDVQPVDPIDLWKSPPFKPEIRNNQVFARGAVDNKGQCFYTITALKALFELAKQIDVNIKVFIEGEEESGGKGTTAILSDRRSELKADHLLVVDFGIPDAQTPAITLGMRGIVTMSVECANSFIDLHSGEHGGIALNPNRALASLIASLWDSRGHIAIPHFYDEVHPLSEKQLASIDTVFDKEKYQKEFGVKAFCSEQGYSLVESNWLRPTLEINGMWGGYTGAGFKTVIPAKAYAKISCRLVPDQEPYVIGKRIAEFLKEKAPAGITIHTEVQHGAPGYICPMESTIVRIAAQAFSEVFDKPSRFQLCGASVPIVGDLAKASGAHVAMIGVGLASDDIHAPNEHFGLDRFERGYLVLGRILSLLSRE